MKRGTLFVWWALYAGAAFGQWSAVWDDLEDYVDGVTTNPPQYADTQLLAELKAATDERIEAVGESALVTATNYYGSVYTLQTIDSALVDLCRVYLHTNYFNSAGTVTNFRQDLDERQEVSYLSDSCTIGDYVFTTNTYYVPHLKPINNDIGENNIALHIDGINAGQIWPYDSGPPFTRLHYRGAFTEYLEINETPLYEAIYTITNATTLTNGAVEYTTGWIFKDHSSLQPYLISTNDFTGSNGWVKARINLNSTNNYNTTTQDLTSVTFTVTGDAYKANWYRPADRFYTTSTKLHLEANTNAVAITGGHQDETAAGIPWANIFTDGVTATGGLITQTSTNLADFTHLGDSITWYWTNGDLNPSENVYLGEGETGQKPNYKSPHGLVYRKRLLNSMVASYTDLTGYRAYNGRVDWSGSIEDTFNDAKTSIASATPSVQDRLSSKTALSYYTMAIQCSSPDYYVGYALTYQARVGVTNLTTNLTCTIDIYGQDESGEIWSFDGDESLWSEWDNPLSNSTRTNGFLIATYTNITGSGDWTIGATNLPTAVATAPAIDGVNISENASSARVVRGHETQIESAVLKWDFTYK